MIGGNLKHMRILFVLALLIMPVTLWAQQTIPTNAVPAVGTVTASSFDSTVVDTTIVTPSPFDFDKILTIESLARYFGANPFLFAVLVGMIFVLTEFTKRKVKKNGELFFVDNRSIALPFVIGIFLAFISPTGFGFWYSIRFGLQGAVAAIIIYMVGNFIWGGSPRRGA